MNDKDNYKKFDSIELMLAVRNKEHDQVVNYLDRGLDVNTQSYFDTITPICLLATSIKNRDAEMAGILITRKADVNIALAQVESADHKYLLNAVKEVESIVRNTMRLETKKISAIIHNQNLNLQSKELHPL
jgi:hypothetical protein